MDESEQSDLEKETDDSHNTCYTSTCNTLYKKMLSQKNCKCGLFSLVLVIKLGGSITEIFSVGLQKTDKSIKAKLNFITM